MDELDSLNASIARLEADIGSIRSLINRAMGALHSEYPELIAQLPRIGAGKVVKEKDCKQVFKKIASKTHQDKLKDKSEAEVSELTEIFCFAKTAYEINDFETLSLIEQALMSSNAKAILIARAKDTLHKKSGELQHLLLSVDYSISLDYLSNDAQRIANARLLFCQVVLSIIASRSRQ